MTPEAVVLLVWLVASPFVAVALCRHLALRQSHQRTLHLLPPPVDRLTPAMRESVRAAQARLRVAR